MTASGHGHHKTQPKPPAAIRYLPLEPVDLPLQDILAWAVRNGAAAAPSPKAAVVEANRLRAQLGLPAFRVVAPRSLRQRPIRITASNS